LWEGPSLIDGSPIVMIGTGYVKGSSNTKTGAMIQTWILRSDMPPVQAVKEGKDDAICGQCPLRGDGTGKERGCYVNVYWAPGRVYETYRRGGYPRLGEDQVALPHAEKVVRLGAYGDPGAVPSDLLRTIVSAAKSWTGYTHQWQTAELQGLCMASVESEDQAKEAIERGYRTFRTIREVAGVSRRRERREILCPASEEAGFRTTCEHCTLCNGSHGDDRRASIAIVVHGAGKKAAAAHVR
jgi:hypothetical protein